jgi:hypothetical protein
MRTTLTLDDDVAALLRRLLRRGDTTLKQLVNDALRRGLQVLTAPPPPRKRFRVVPLDAGPPLVDHVDCVAEALALAEGEGYK